MATLSKKILLLLCVMGSGRALGADHTDDGGDGRIILASDAKLSVPANSPQLPQQEPHQLAAAHVFLQDSYRNRQDSDIIKYPFRPLEQNSTKIMSGFADEDDKDCQKLNSALQQITITQSVRHVQSNRNHHQSSEAYTTVDISPVANTIKARLEKIHQQDLAQKEIATRQATLNNLPFYQRRPGLTFVAGMASGLGVAFGVYKLSTKYNNRFATTNQN